MKTPPPEVGKMYVSRTDHTVRLYVEAVHLVDADEEEGIEEGCFMVEACDPADIDNPGGIGIEYMDDEWAEGDFISESELTAKSGGKP